MIALLKQKNYDHILKNCNLQMITIIFMKIQFNKLQKFLQILLLQK